ncbi:MAG: tRNA (5-methylaminomethyl-2-thiouridine)(34)-methyltransferase MnmD [Alphaproteobacteria bacterium]|nr:tRNA (5-methylaminomethyl-2-thiouridine)(34)-methyltransferase MnmD [Alphaproteobacteria bacterium]
MSTTPRSEVFDDVYFSAQDGLAETEHTFLAGNDLPARWAGCSEFTIAETGFGTGLNFLAVWKMFAETGAADQKLHFISFEKFPLSAAQIRTYLTPLLLRPIVEGAFVDSQGYKPFLEQFLALYTEQSGTYALGDRVRLTLIFEDVNTAISALDVHVDAWFLDGFKPSTNPEMWNAHVFSNIARLSVPGTTLATFTAAGFVRRGLVESGFKVQKIKGYGTKREMTVGVKCA